MSVRWLVPALFAGSLITPAYADHAQARSGGSHSSPSGGRHHPSGGASARSGGDSSHGGAAQGGRPSGGTTVAERRHPRAGTGTGSYGYGYHGYYPHSHGYYGGGYYPYYRPYFYGSWWPYDGYYSSGYYGGGYYGGYYGRGYAYGFAPAYTYRSGSDAAALRVFVDPEKTRVYLDGAYAGVADDFDGVFQRLYLAPGGHELTFKLDGYRAHRMRVYVTPGQTLKIEHDMRKGAGEDTFEDLSGGRDDRDAPEGRPQGEYQHPHDRPAPDARGGDLSAPPEPGRLRLDVRPGDASVYVDGEFRGTAAQLGELTLPTGPHRIEVVRPGFRTEERDVDVAPGSSRAVTIELPRP